MKTVAHCISPYLQTAGPWVYEQIRRVERYRPVVLTQGARNLEHYPVESLYSAEAFPPVKKLCNRIWRRATNSYPFYAEILRGENAALIHAHFGYEAYRLLRASRATALPLLTTFYGADATEYPRYPRWRERYLRLFAEGALFLAEGGAMAQKLVDIGCPQDKVRVWRLGVDVERIEFVPRVAGERVRLLICAGHKEKKGIPYALKALAAALVQKPFPYALTLVGDGEDRPQIETLVDELGLRSCTSFRGMRPYAEVLAELPQHDILLQTSITAKNGDGEGGAPVILLDAQASGMPVVATTHGDIPAYVRDGESGLLAGERDVEGLAEHIIALATEPELWAEMGRAGRSHVEQCYDAARQVAELEAIYDELV